MTQCPKCRAGRGALYAQTSQLAQGVALDQISCIRCGWMKSEPRSIAAPRVRQHRPAPESSAPTPRTNYAKKPCTREGCAGVYSHSKFKLCQKCADRHYKWLNTDMTTPPPYISAAADQGWIDNPHKKTYQKRKVAP